ncbi:MAG: HK97 family phage prohead protease [Sphingobium sp.]
MSGAMRCEESARGGAVGAGVRFAGYAALFDREDRGGDIIRKGAFARAIAQWRGRRVPLLWQHRPDRPIGMIECMAEDVRGLRVIGRVIGRGTGHGLARGGDGDAVVREAAALLRAGRVNGLSFGYRVRRAEGRVPRVLRELDLIEVSVVSFPMQPGARVHAVEGVPPPA